MTNDDTKLTAADYEQLLKDTLERLKQTVFDPDTPPRDLAALSRRMLEVCRELERLQNDERGDLDVSEVEDEEFDPSEI